MIYPGVIVLGLIVRAQDMIWLYRHQHFKNPSTHSSTQILQRKVHQLEVNTQTWGRVRRKVDDDGAWNHLTFWRKKPEHKFWLIDQTLILVLDNYITLDM